MTRNNNENISFDEFDDLNSDRDGEAEIYGIIERAMNRRGFLGAGAAFAAAALTGGPALLAPGRADAAMAGRLAFAAVAANSEDTITVPQGYTWNVVAAWGDPLWTGAAGFDHATRGTGESQEKAFGDNTDGMYLFSYRGRSILTVNNEYVNVPIIYGNRDSKKPETADDVRKGKAGHGITVMEIALKDGKWGIVKDSPFNRRITADSPMQITGPAAGHDWLKTAADPTGTQSLGTWNNCANGHTPWGTYLTCEENFNGYFSSSDDAYEPTDAMKRYGIGKKDWGYNWAMTDDRFDISKHPNECNRAGYVVEIDPFDPASTPRKRTALGRFKHENAEVVVNPDGHVVVYLGDDERGEFLYRFVSAGKYVKGGDNRDLLETGTLSVARFGDDMRGQWVALTPATTGMASQAEICIHTRQAASKVGATTMDRPEWVAANPTRAEVYCSLTNNKNRGKKPNAGGDATPVGGPNPRADNRYGQIVRWRPDGGDHTAEGFAWDLFVLAGNPTVHQDDRKGSANVTADNMFNSPDGLKFDASGILWIQTDGNYSNAKDFAGQGNNQMLAADADTGEIRRFLVGPKECEITGLTWSADRRTMFVGIQHPGERGDSHFPGGGDSVPRSCIIAVARADGAVIG
ncbi:MAG: PhoX family phosphatase [Hyphomicrobiales bacterium]|nr:PhoX family phosphatase [Hyphomicrobiales bacterium]MCP5373127.1 PhoX family phosphatase [Hyphomicrobiales bacterium]